MKSNRKNKKRAVLRIILLVTAGIIIGLTLYKAAACGTGNLMPMPFGIGSAVVQSGSMEPTYKKGDLLFVKKADEYKVGDIVVYRSRNILVVHRMIAVDGDLITTKGDANNTPDEPFDRSAVKGKVTARIPFVGLIIDRVRSPIGILIILVLAILFVEISCRKSFETSETGKDKEDIEAIKAEIKKLKEEKEARGNKENQ